MRRPLSSTNRIEISGRFFLVVVFFRLAVFGFFFAFSVIAFSLYGIIGVVFVLIFVVIARERGGFSVVFVGLFAVFVVAFFFVAVLVIE